MINIIEKIRQDIENLDRDFLVNRARLVVRLIEEENSEKMAYFHPEVYSKCFYCNSYIIKIDSYEREIKGEKEDLAEGSIYIKRYFCDRNCFISFITEDT